MPWKRCDGGDLSWQPEALRIYGECKVLGTTHRRLVEGGLAVSFAAVRSFLRAEGVLRVYKKVKTWRRQCVTCFNDFDARAPRVMQCETCVGGRDLSTRMSSYAKWRKQQEKLHQFGLDAGALRAILKEQDECCGLCIRKLEVPCLDHDHATGKARGFLCHRCNLTLGQVEAAGGTEWLKRAEAWLTRGASPAEDDTDGRTRS